MTGRIVKIGQHHYRMREYTDWTGSHCIAFDLVYWVEEALPHG